MGRKPMGNRAMTAAERQARKRDKTANCELHLHQSDDLGVLWSVRVKDGLGSYVHLTEDLPKTTAARRMRRIREAMVRMWLAAPETKREAVLLGLDKTVN